jgi:hypothetical protein
MSTDRPDLYLHEQVMLLALRDDRGTVESRAGWYSLALGGAILSELLLRGSIAVADDKNKLVDVVERRRSGDPILDECLDKIATAKRRRSATDWVRAFAGIRRLRHRVAEGLCRRGILKDSEDKVLLMFTRKIYPTLDPAPERRLREQLRRAIVRDTMSVDARVAILIALAHATGLLRVHFDARELKAHKKRLLSIARGDLIGGATKAAVDAAVQAAMMAAIGAATTITTTAAIR